jgi:hypothetical protein
MSKDYIEQSDLGGAMERLLDSMYYSYRGYKAERRSYGRVLIAGELLTKAEFHKRIDDTYTALEESVNRTDKAGDSLNRLDK